MYIYWTFHRKDSNIIFSNIKWTRTCSSFGNQTRTPYFWLRTIEHPTSNIVRPITKNHFFTFQVHPCGRYRHNTVVFILAKEHGLKNLRTIHRLDRLTSGLLLFGRNPKKAREMEQQIRTRQVQKEYVCRVEGEFPA